MYHETNLILNEADEAPIARPGKSRRRGYAVIHLPGLALHGPNGQVRAWLQAGLDALDDDASAVTPLHGGPRAS